jgi:prepilin-type N-terminal cleavage/methylation domain-containing protein
MIKKYNKRKGFTLIELLISIVIFVFFLGLVSTSYISIVRTQKEANEVRKIYSELRTFVEILAEEIRLSAVDYDCYESSPSFTDEAYYCADVIPPLTEGRSNYLALVRKGGKEKTVFKFEDNKVFMTKAYKQNNVWSVAPGYDALVGQSNYQQILSDNLDITNLTFYIFPDVNPYSSEHYRENAKQFQPKVTVFMSVKNGVNEKSNFEFDFQTSVSSRVYSRAI